MIERLNDRIQDFELWITDNNLQTPLLVGAILGCFLWPLSFITFFFFAEVLVSAACQYIIEKRENKA